MINEVVSVKMPVKEKIRILKNHLNRRMLPGEKRGFHLLQAFMVMNLTDSMCVMK